MIFEWNDAKNDHNIKKHGIDFHDVAEMFHHPMLIQLDTRQHYGEDRWIGIGLLRNTVAVVIYIEWEDEETVRIISARKATRDESKKYHQRITHRLE